MMPIMAPNAHTDIPGNPSVAKSSVHQLNDRSNIMFINILEQVLEELSHILMMGNAMTPDADMGIPNKQNFIVSHFRFPGLRPELLDQ